MKKLIPRIIGFWINFLAIFSPRVAGRKGFDLFCSPFGSPVKDYQKRFLDTAEQFTLLLNGNPVKVYRWGNGPRNILFLHGWQSHTFRWKNYVEAFSKEEFTLYAIDAPAHGLSGGRFLNLPIYSSVIEEFFRQFDPVETIVSHSLGSFAALYTLHRIPSTPVGNLVITGTPGEAAEFFTFYKTALGLSQRAERAIRNEFVERLSRPPEYFSARVFAASVNIPGLIIHDEGDPDAPFHHAGKIHRAWKGSQLIATKGLGHNLRSNEVIRHIVEFVGRKEFIRERALV